MKKLRRIGRCKWWQEGLILRLRLAWIELLEFLGR